MHGFNEFNDEDVSKTYNIKDPKNGLYAFIIDGDAKIEGHNLNTRDRFGIWDKNEISLLKQNIDILKNIIFMDMPMSIYDNGITYSKSLNSLNPFELVSNLILSRRS